MGKKRKASSHTDVATCFKKQKTTFKQMQLDLMIMKAANKQLKLFIKTHADVFRNLEEEGTYVITPDIRKLFEPQVMYEKVLSKHIPWRKWDSWLRGKIIAYLKDLDEFTKITETVFQELERAGYFAERARCEIIVGYPERSVSLIKEECRKEFEPQKMYEILITKANAMVDNKDIIIRKLRRKITRYLAKMQPSANVTDPATKPPPTKKPKKRR